MALSSEAIEARQIVKLLFSQPNPTTLTYLPKIDRPPAPISFIDNPQEGIRPYTFNFDLLDDNAIIILAQCMYRRIQRDCIVKPKYLVPVPRGGERFTDALTLISGIKRLDLLEKIFPGIQGREKVRARINPQKGDREWVLLVDDYIDTGSAAAPGIEALRRLGYLVAGVTAVVDEEIGGSDFIREGDFGVYPLITIPEAFSVAQGDDLKLITAAQHQQALKYRKSLSGYR